MADPASLAATVVKALLGKLGDFVYEEFSLIYGAKSRFRKLEDTLRTIDTVLLDAEEQQYKNHTVKKWLSDIKDAAYEIEDVLDLISTEHLEHEVNGIDPYGRLNGLYSRYCFVNQAKEICLRLDEIAKIKNDFNFQGHLPGEIGSHRKRTTETYSYVDQSGVFGRKQDKESILSRLVDSESKQLLVIPITGMGGIGKTTLAQLVYNDPRVEAAFSLKLWVYVSEKFSLQTVIGDIIQSSTVDNCSQMKLLQALQNKLREILTGRTFLLVLDDVWMEREDSLEWQKLKELLAVGSRGAILVTTREESVADITGTMESCKLLELCEDDCWSIFVNCAFKGEPNPSLERIGKSIVQKCKGVPLAVKTIGTLLCSYGDVNKWKEIEKSDIWMTCKDRILPALKLSYDHTPYHLRSCFAYCALFGKGYTFQRIDLVNIWMAQGLLDEKKKEKDMEDVGDEYFEELLSRSFFQIPGDAVIEKYVMQVAGVLNWNPDWASLKQGFERKMIGDVDSVRKMFTDYRGKLPFVEMHDLFEDLAAYVAGEEIVSGISSSSSSCKLSDKARHIAWCKEDLSGKEFPKDLSKPSKVRTFAFLHPMGSLSKSFLESLLLHFKCLRVLMLLKSEFEELPDLIGDLKHLRYLDISVNSKLKLLPNAISKLVNLQVLDFGHCIELEKLPKDIHRLVSLRTLILTSKATCLLKRGFKCWSSLRILQIISCPNFTSLPEGIGSLENLKVFGVESCSRVSFLPDDMKQLTNLEELSIGHCGQLDLAQWKGLHGLKKLRYLRLYGIPKLANFPNGLKSVARSLKHFKIGDCKALTSLPEELQHCTSLSKLQVFCCDKPRALPTGIQALEDLQELTIVSCSGLRERCERENGADWHLISHIPYIQIDNQVIQDNRAASTQQ